MTEFFLGVLLMNLFVFTGVAILTAFTLLSAWVFDFDISKVDMKIEKVFKRFAQAAYVVFLVSFLGLIVSLLVNL